MRYAPYFLLIILLAVGVFSLKERMSPAVSAPVVAPVSQAVTPDLSSLGSTSTIAIPGGTISLVKPSVATSATIKHPDLNRPIVFRDNESSKVHEAMKANIELLVTTLKKDPTSFESWNRLALFRNAILDYEGARDIWEYLGKLNPKNSLTFANLGFLYGYSLKEPALGEKNYLTSIENDPRQFQTYAQLFELYRDVMRDKAKAETLLSTMGKIFPEQAGEIAKLKETL